MNRIGIASLLSASCVLVYLVASGEVTVLQQRLAADGGHQETKINRESNRYSHQATASIKDHSEQEVNLNDPKTRTKLKMMIKTRELQEVSDHVDWEKLRDHYLTALYSEESSTRRNLKKRAPRARGKRRKSWNLSKIEKDLEQEASKAIGQAKGIRKSDSDAKGGKKGVAKPTSGVNSALQSAQRAGKKAAKGSSGSNLPNSRGPKRSGDPLSSAPAASAAPVASPVTSAPVVTDYDIEAVDNNNDQEFPIVMTTSELNAAKDAAKEGNGGSTRQSDSASFNGKPMPSYSYKLGNCPGAGDSAAAVPCAPDNLPKICSKYDGDEGLLSLCLEACIPSFCCIHDAPPATNFIAPSCSEDVNCPQYAYCYIAWWKLHDTIGPATQLRFEQNDDFFDLDADFVTGDVTAVSFYREMLFHHFDDANEIIRLGTQPFNETTAIFNSDLIFLNETYWNTTI